jgi:hypothetical protein
MSPRTVRRLAERGILTRVKILGATRYRSSELQCVVRHGAPLSDVERLLGDRAGVSQ